MTYHTGVAGWEDTPTAVPAVDSEEWAVLTAPVVFCSTESSDIYFVFPFFFPVLLKKTIVLLYEQ